MSDKPVSSKSTSTVASAAAAAPASAVPASAVDDKKGGEKVPPLAEHIKIIMKQIDTKLINIPIFKTISEKTGQPPSVLVCVMAGLFVLIILYSHGMSALCNLVGFGYPVYASFKALKSEGASDDTEWLIYWVSFGFFVVLEDFADLFFEYSMWSTVYYTFKLGVVIWMMLPQTKGANWVFNNIVQPVLKRYESQIDASFHLSPNPDDAQHKAAADQVTAKPKGQESAAAAAAPAATSTPAAPAATASASASPHQD